LLTIDTSAADQGKTLKPAAAQTCPKWNRFPTVEDSNLSRWKPRTSPSNRYYRYLVLLVEQPARRLVNCIRAPCAPSHTEIGNFPPPRPWKRSRAND